MVKPGGLVIAAAISRFASLFSGLAYGQIADARFRAIVDRDLLDGQHRNPDRIADWFTTAYFHHPDELEREAAEAGAAIVELVGVEGLACWLPQLAEQWTDPELRESIVRTARVVESEPSLRGVSAHMLLVTRRPGG